jgi:3',5'-cyclic AMP phosphodiesterase CpdA
MSGRRRITRRRALAEALAAAGAGVGVGGLALAGCGGGGRSAARAGSTRQSTWADPLGDAQLRVGPGEPLVDRLELGARAEPAGVLATLAHITDAHVLDASSPARVTFLDRLGSPLQSTFRPQEALTAQVLAGAVASVRALAPQLVIQGGDLIDNDQDNELRIALSVLGGGTVDPGSGPDGYHGVQLASNPDPFYYRPDIDAPRHPGLLRAAVRPFRSAGLRSSWCPVFGDHDALVAGELVPSAVTEALAVGDRALWDLPRGLTVPPGERLTTGPGTSPDGPPQPLLVDQLLTEALQGPTVTVPPDPARRELAVSETISRLRAATGGRLGGGLGGGRGGGLAVAATERLDYSLAVGPRLQLVVLDLARRDGGSGGLIVPGQADWLDGELSAAGDRWVIVVSHQPLASSEGGDALLALLDRSPRVIATLAGHTHRNRILARPTGAGGYWQIATASLIDYPQQARALRVVATAGGGVAIQTWMLDHVLPGSLGTISRQLSFLDAQGGRPQGFAGARLDRNVTLYRREVS